MNDEMEIDLKSLQVYYSRREKDLVSCIVALQMQDFDAIARMGHKMKGNGQTFGFPEISEIGAALEKFGIAQDSEKLQSSISDFKTWITSNSGRLSET